MKKLLLTLLLILISSTYAFPKKKYCYIQIASFKNRKFAERIYRDKNLKTDATVYILKRSGFYTIRVGPFENFKRCKLEKKKIKAELKKYRVKPILLLRNYSAPPSETILKEKSAGKTKSEKYETGQKLKGKSSESINKIKRNNPDSFNEYIYIEKAKVCMGKKDCTNAVKYLRLALKKDRKNPKLYTYLGYAYMHLKRYEDSMNAFLQALEINPNYAEAYAGIGLLYLKLNSPKVAATAFEKAYSLKPDEVSYGLNLAISLLEGGETDKAISILNNLKRKNPFLAEVYYNEAIAYLKKKDCKDALKDFETFLELTKGYKAYVNYRMQVKGIINQLRPYLRGNDKP